MKVGTIWTRAAAPWSAIVVGICALGASCADDPVGLAAEYIQGGSPPDVTVDGTGRVVNDSRQWARDSSVRVFGGDHNCSGTLVSPRLVLTNAHCVRPAAATDVWFSPLNPRGTVGEIVPGTPAGVTVGIARCEIHPERDGACGDGFDSGGSAQENDLAILVLNERFDASPHSNYRVIPAHVVENDPENIPEEWVFEQVWMAGYGREGLFADSGINRMRLVAITHVASVWPRQFFTAHERGWAGDSGCGVFVFRTDDGSPLQLLGVNHAGNGTSSIAVRLTASGMQRFLGDFLGPSEDHYPGAMVAVGTTEVWTGGQDLPRADEPGRAAWRDPDTGQSAREVDPDGDGLRGRHDNCWGIFNPRQDVEDVSLERTCRSVSTGATFTYGCAPRPDVFDGIGSEGSNDRDGDGVLDLCDNCVDVPNPRQEQCRLDCVEGQCGDACQPDRDFDGVPDICDNCEATYNPGQRVCNIDTPHLHPTRDTPLGAACLPTPCPNVRPAVREERGPLGDVVAQANDLIAGHGLVTDVDVDSTAGRVDLGGGCQAREARITGVGTGEIATGFRFCPCDFAGGSDVDSRDRCASSSDFECVQNANEFTRPGSAWRPMTLDYERPEVLEPPAVIPYHPRPTARRTFVDPIGTCTEAQLSIPFPLTSPLETLRARWDFAADAAALGIPTATSSVPGTPFGATGDELLAVRWAHAARYEACDTPPCRGPGGDAPPGAGLRSLGVASDQSSRYWSGATFRTTWTPGRPPDPNPRPFIRPPLPPEICWYCFDAFPELSLAPCLGQCPSLFVQRRADGIDLPFDGLVTVAASEALATEGIQWVAPREPRELLLPRAVRLVGLEGDRVVAVMTAVGNRLGLLGEKGVFSDVVSFDLAEPVDLIDFPQADGGGRHVARPCPHDGATMLMGNAGWLVGLGSREAVFTPLFEGAEVSRLDLHGELPERVVTAALHMARAEALILGAVDGGRRASIALVDLDDGSVVELARFPAPGVFDHHQLLSLHDGRYALVASSARAGRTLIFVLDTDGHQLFVHDLADERGVAVGPASASTLGLSIPLERGGEAWRPVGFRFESLRPVPAARLRAAL